MKKQNIVLLCPKNIFLMLVVFADKPESGRLVTFLFYSGPRLFRQAGIYLRAYVEARAACTK